MEGILFHVTGNTWPDEGRHRFPESYFLFLGSIMLCVPVDIHLKADDNLNNEDVSHNFALYSYIRIRFPLYEQSVAAASRKFLSARRELLQESPTEEDLGFSARQEQKEGERDAAHKFHPRPDGRGVEHAARNSSTFLQQGQTNT